MRPKLSVIPLFTTGGRSEALMAKPTMAYIPPFDIESATPAPLELVMKVNIRWDCHKYTRYQSSHITSTQYLIIIRKSIRIRKAIYTPHNKTNHKSQQSTNNLISNTLCNLKSTKHLNHYHVPIIHTGTKSHSQNRSHKRRNNHRSNN